MRFYLRKLGCPKNDVDAEYIAARLISDGHQPVDSPEDADAIIVNTCGFIQAAKEESIEEILRLGQLKKERKERKLYATGCLTQRYGNELLEGIPELDGAFGLGALDSIATAVGKPEATQKLFKTEAQELSYLSWKSRFSQNNLPYAYLKISDGCNRLCSFCAIPAIRGRYRSSTSESMVQEATHLAKRGKKELILVSQEGTLWGNDLKRGEDITHLLSELDRVDGIEWIRLMYLYPSQVSDKLIEYIASDNKTLNYFDLPLQHVDDTVLSDMRRRVNRSKIEILLERIRSIAPDAVIRTAFIVGFPGETDEQFEELLDFVQEYEFDRLGAFVFSAEEGTPAANLPDKVPSQVAQDRYDRLMQTQLAIVRKKNNSLIGKQVEVIIDSVEPGCSALGRTQGDCPDVDQEVHVSGDLPEVGDICLVRIEAVEDYDLVGVRIRE